MESEKEKLFRPYAWSHFTFHAERRWVVLKVALLTAAVLSAGMIWLLLAGANRWLSVPLGIILAVLALFFRLLDKRCLALMRSSEAALRALDAEQGLPDSQEGVPHPARIFDGASARKGGFLGLCRCGDGLITGAIYLLIAVEGAYFSALPFYVEKLALPPSIVAAAPAPAALAPPAARTPPPRREPYPYQPGLNPQRPNIPPNAQFPRPLPTTPQPVYPPNNPPPGAQGAIPPRTLYPGPGGAPGAPGGAGSPAVPVEAVRSNSPAVPAAPAVPNSPAVAPGINPASANGLQNPSAPGGH